jgi:hypothetical protein
LRERIYRGFGNLHYWSGAFGIQVAPGLGIGIAPSYVSGTETIRDNWRETTTTSAADTTDEKERTYNGFDVRVGALYSHPKSNVRIGARLVLPQTIGFVETSSYSGEWHGTLRSSFSGAFGVAATLPFMTLASEIRFRAPYDMIFPEKSLPESSPAHYFKNGAGIGGEIPLSSSNILLRFGYSYDEYDPYQFAMKYDGEEYGAGPNSPAWGTDGVTVDDNRQAITLGCAYIVSDFSFDLSYGYQFWGITTTTTSSTRPESDRLQRILVSMATRF